MKLRAKITGDKVHEVGYRVSLLEMAQDLGLSGFEAQNRKEDGCQVVLIFMEGDEDQIAEFKGFIEKERPDGAEVSAVVFEDYQGCVMDIDRFSQRTNTKQLNKGINALLSIDQKQDKILEKLDETKVDIVHEIRESRDAIVDKLEETGGFITSEIRGQKSSINQRFDRIEDDISRIKTKIGLS